VEIDPVFVFLLVLVLGTILFVYFLLRRALVGFKRGYDDARRDR
jgi:hypothetical protein